MAGRSHQATLCVYESHPSLPGQFPGRPIVPGVVLLDHVLASAEDWLRQSLHVISIKQAKFLAPLLPLQEATVELALDAEELRFALKRGAELIAQGAFKVSLA